MVQCTHDDFRAGRFRLVVSDVTAAEVALAPEQSEIYSQSYWPFGESFRDADALDLLWPMRHEVYWDHAFGMTCSISLLRRSGGDVLVIGISSTSCG